MNNNNLIEQLKKLNLDNKILIIDGAFNWDYKNIIEVNTDDKWYITLITD